MTYVVRRSTEYPFFLRGEWADFERKVPTLSGQSEVSSVFMDGKRLLDQNGAPETLKLLKEYRSIPDIFVTGAGAMVVSQRMHAFIDALDPGQHQFLPVKIVEEDDEVSRFILNIYVRQDSIVDEQSHVSTMTFKGFDRDKMAIEFYTTREKGLPTEGQVDVAFDSAVLGHLNMWRERRYPSALFVSNNFVEELEKQHLEFLDLQQGRDISR